MNTASSFPASLDAFYLLTNKRSTPQPIAGEVFTVPTGSPYDHVLLEVPSSGTLSLGGTPVGGGGTYTLQSTVPTASGQVQVDYKTGRLTFHSSDFGGTVSASYDGLGSSISAERFHKAYNALVAIETALGAGVVPSGYASLKEYLDAEIGSVLAEANSPADEGFVINAGHLFIDRNTRVNVSLTAIDLTTGTYQFPSTTLNYYRKALFTVDSSGTVKVYWSAAASTANGCVAPSRPLDEFPVCLLTAQNDGSATTAGLVLPVDAADLIDLRHNLSVEFDTEADGFSVQQTAVKSTSVLFRGSSFLYQPAAAAAAVKRAVANDTLDFGTGGGEEVSAITANHWNVVLITVDETGAIVLYEGTSNATKGSVTLPPIPEFDCLPVALVYFQDDGTGTAGTILPIPQSDIVNLYPQRTAREEDASTTPDLTLADVDDFRVHAAATPNKTVVVEPGRVIAQMGQIPAAFAGGTISFASGGHQKTVTGANWLPVVLALDLEDLATVNSYDGYEGLSKGATVAPRIPERMMPLALVYVQGDGTGTAGGIEDVTDADIIDVRGSLKSAAWALREDHTALRVRENTKYDTSVVIEKGYCFFEHGVFRKKTGDTTFDVAAALSTAFGASKYKWILLTLDDAGTFAIVEPSAAGGTTEANAPMPALSTTKKNLAMILCQDDGSNVAGAIEAITDENIHNLTFPTIARHYVGDWFSAAANTNYTITHGLNRIPRGVTVLWQSDNDGDAGVDITLVPGLPFLNAGVSVIEMGTTTLKVRTADALAAYYDSGGSLQKPTSGYLRVNVW